MNDRVVALRVGIVILAAAFITGFLIILLGEGRTFFQSRYALHLKFPQAPGVAIDTPVRKDGVLIGRVTQVTLRDEGGVVISVRIDAERKVFKNEIPRIATSSLLGDSVVEFMPLANSLQPRVPVTDGEFIGDGIVAADPIRVLTNLEGDVRRTLASFENTANNVSALSNRLNDVLGGQDTQRFTALLDKTELALTQFNKTMITIDNVIGDPELSERLKQGLADFPQTLDEMRQTFGKARETLDGFKGMQAKADKNLDNLEKFTKPLGERGDELVGNINDILQNLDTMTSTVAELADRIRHSDGTIAKLIRDDEMYEKIADIIDNWQDASRRIRPIMDDVRVFTDKIATDPRQLGVKGGLDRRPLGVGIKGVTPSSRESIFPFNDEE